MAYISYNNAEIRVAPSQARPRLPQATLAWSRLAVIAISALAWVGIIAGLRAIF